MNTYKTISDLSLQGKKVLTRLDLNVPLKDGKVKDTTRIDASLETIKYILENKGKAILMSHLGRPEGKKDESLSLRPVAEVLSDKLGKDVMMAEDCVGEEVEELTKIMKEGDILLLENLRFHSEEEENEESFVKQLADVADIYINDAFGTAHRAHASTYGVPKLCKQEGKEIAAGFLMAEELEIWKPVVEAKGKKVAIIGGAKLKEKMKAVKKLAKTFDRIILGGVVSNVFMKASGYDIKESKYLEKDKDYSDDAKEILEKFGDKVILPSIVACSTKDFEHKGEGSVHDLKEGCLSADVILCPDDLKAIKEAEVLVWFGPMGAYEFGFTKGSDAVVAAINESSAYAVIGGGDVAAAAKGVKAKISTGGGASIAYITTGSLEALEALS